MVPTNKKIVLITGGSSGLGFESIKALIQTKQPHHIFLGCLIDAEGQSAVLSLQQDVPETPSTLEAISVDVTNDKSIDQCFHVIQSTVGHLDVLINNAGKILPPIPTCSSTAPIFRFPTIIFVRRLLKLYLTRDLPSGGRIGHARRMESMLRRQCHRSSNYDP